MHETYNPNRLLKLCALVALTLLMTACESLQIKPSQTDNRPPKNNTSPVAAKEKPCACEQAATKQVVTYIDKPCPALPTSPANKNQAKPASTDKLIVGRVEYVVLSANGLAIKARVDTGAKTSSLNAQDLTVFERDGKKWARFAVINPSTEGLVYFERKVERFVRIKQMESDYQRRPVVKMALQLGPLDESMELTLTDRSDYVYQLLVGRNFLLDRMLVDVSQKYIAK